MDKRSIYEIIFQNVRDIRDDWSDSVIDWEKANGRTFQWRKYRSPYRVLLSEFLLKRTTSKAAERVYKKFLAEYPDLLSLSSADKEDIEKILLEVGLHKQRSTLIQDMSKYLIVKYNGKIPNNFEDLIKIPGVGDYSASAVLVFGFDIPKAIVDSNVNRILTRAFSVKGKQLINIAEELIPTDNAVLYNYGLLDLGATVCHYKNIHCDECPVKIFCNYFKRS